MYCQCGGWHLKVLKDSVLKSFCTTDSPGTLVLFTYSFIHSYIAVEAPPLASSLCIVFLVTVFAKEGTSRSHLSTSRRNLPEHEVIAGSSGLRR